MQSSIKIWLDMFIADMSDEEMQALVRGLGNLHQFLEDLV